MSEYLDYIADVQDVQSAVNDLTLNMYQQGRADQKAEDNSFINFDEIIRIECNKARAEVIEEISKKIAFEEKWLRNAIREDKRNYAYNIDIAFGGIKSSLNTLKEHCNE